MRICDGGQYLSIWLVNNLKPEIQYLKIQPNRNFTTSLIMLIAQASLMRNVNWWLQYVYSVGHCSINSHRKNLCSIGLKRRMAKLTFSWPEYLLPLCHSVSFTTLIFFQNFLAVTETAGFEPSNLALLVDCSTNEYVLPRWLQ